jgi:hypothetical protein
MHPLGAIVSSITTIDGTSWKKIGGVTSGSVGRTEGHTLQIERIVVRAEGSISIANLHGW